MKDPRYTVKLESYEGPLDLLLLLIKRHEVDIYNISIESLTHQYLEHIQAIQALNIPLASDFISMGAHLIYLKSQALLPDKYHEKSPSTPSETPEWELIKQLLEYKKFKDASEKLSYQFTEQQKLYPSHPASAKKNSSETLVDSVSLHDLTLALNNVLAKLPASPQKAQTITSDPHSVTETMQTLLQTFSLKPLTPFSQLFKKSSVREEVITIFLALLELLRLQSVHCQQLQPFGEILIGVSTHSTNS